MAEDEVRCPKCGSNELTTIKKEISEKKSPGEIIISGVVAVLLGIGGLLTGSIGGKEIIFTCTKCGHQFHL